MSYIFFSSQSVSNFLVSDSNSQFGLESIRDCLDAHSIKIEDAYEVTLGAQKYFKISIKQEIEPKTMKQIFCQISGTIEAEEFEPESELGQLISESHSKHESSLAFSHQDPMNPHSVFQKEHGLSASTHSALATLKSCLDIGGVLEKTNLPVLSPTHSKSKLIFTELNDLSAKDFCSAAANTVAENILHSCWTDSRSPFLGSKLQDILDAISHLSFCGTLEAGIALALLVHASKCRGRAEFLKFGSLAIISRNLRLTDPVSTEALDFAGKYLQKEPLKSILLSNTSGMDDFLTKVKPVFVELEDKQIRGWCGPRMVIINRFATRNTPLEEPAPFLVLFGHETRHVVVRECNDFNFSTPEKPQLKSSCNALAYANRESGLWFELTAIGEKYDFVGKIGPAFHDEMRALISAMHEGIVNGCSPALSAEQRKRFFFLGAPYDSEMPFECEDLCPCHFME